MNMCTRSVVLALSVLSASGLRLRKYPDEVTHYKENLNNELARLTNELNDNICKSFVAQGEARIAEFTGATTALNRAVAAMETRSAFLKDLNDRTVTALAAAKDAYPKLLESGNAVSTNPLGQVNAIKDVLQLQPTLVVEDWTNLHNLLQKMVTETTAQVTMLNDKLTTRSTAVEDIRNLFTHPQGTNFKCPADAAENPKKTDVSPYIAGVAKKYETTGVSEPAAASDGEGNALDKANPRVAGVMKFKASELQLIDDIALESYLMKEILGKFEGSTSEAANTLIKTAFKADDQPDLEAAIKAVFTYFDENAENAETDMGKKVAGLKDAYEELGKIVSDAADVEINALIATGKKIADLELAHKTQEFVAVFESAEVGL